MATDQKRTHRSERASRNDESGFTLFEILLVVVIVGIMTRVVVPAFGSDVPIAEAKAEANKIAAVLGYLRSESRLQSESYGLEIQTPEQEAHRFRILMPNEKRIQRDGEIDEPIDDINGRPDFFTMDWQYLPDQVYIRGVHVGRLERDRPLKAREITFDPRGRTPQKIIEIGHRNDEGIVYSIIVAPLSGAIEVREGSGDFRTATDGDFF